MPDRPPGSVADDVAETAGKAASASRMLAELVSMISPQSAGVIEPTTTEFRMLTRLANATWVRATNVLRRDFAHVRKNHDRHKITWRSYDVGEDTDVTIDRLAGVNGDISRRINVEAVVPCLVNSIRMKIQKSNSSHCSKASIRGKKTLGNHHIRSSDVRKSPPFALTWILWLRRILEYIKTVTASFEYIGWRTHVDHRQIPCLLARDWHPTWPNGLHYLHTCLIGPLGWLDFEYHMFHLEFGRPNARHQQRSYSLDKTSSRVKIERYTFQRCTYLHSYTNRIATHDRTIIVRIVLRNRRWLSCSRPIDSGNKIICHDAVHASDNNAGSICVEDDIVRQGCAVRVARANPINELFVARIRHCCLLTPRWNHRRKSSHWWN